MIRFSLAFDHHVDIVTRSLTNPVLLRASLSNDSHVGYKGVLYFRRAMAVTISNKGMVRQVQLVQKPVLGD